MVQNLPESDIVVTICAGCRAAVYSKAFVSLEGNVERGAADEDY